VSPAVSIPERFNGPPQSANGGFACGTLARAMGARAAQVNLRLPPPLDVPLEVVAGAEQTELRAGGEVVADGRALDGLEVTPPAQVDLEQAAAASHAYPWFESHIFPTCFVCGPRRPRADGLELYAGPTGQEAGLHAAPWTPSGEWEEDGRVRDEIVWAALDCPSAVPVLREAPAVLASLSASLEQPVLPGHAHIVVSWVVETVGRKLHSASAILDEDGRVLARARALWIELRPGG
jgi:hypothetical protein